MPRKRIPYETWYNNVRPIIWKRDGRRCKRCGVKVELNKCHIDHIKSGKSGTNKFKNLRTLCYKCHALRLDYKHRGLIKGALTKGIISVNWRNKVWRD